MSSFSSIRAMLLRWPQETVGGLRVASYVLVVMLMVVLLLLLGVECSDLSTAHRLVLDDESVVSTYCFAIVAISCVD
jgi:hypothetical protein